MRSFLRLTGIVVAGFAVALLMAGTTVAETASCVSDCDCEIGQICNPAGVCGVVLCPDLWDPVCGVDGRTYANSCELRNSHVALAHSGECKLACGGFVGMLCPEEMYCELPAGKCGTADLQGYCETRPEVCPYVYLPVCGCDGTTYSNDCSRRQHGVQKRGDGPCEQEEPALLSVEPCSVQNDCPKSQYCAFKLGACKDPGKCLDLPHYCPEIFDPVCGCNDQTYPNACLAAVERQSVQHKGPCGERSEDKCVLRPSGICTMDINRCGHPSSCICPDGYHYNAAIGMCLLNLEKTADTSEGSSTATGCIVNPSGNCTKDINPCGHASWCECPKSYEYDPATGLCLSLHP